MEKNIGSILKIFNYAQGDRIGAVQYLKEKGFTPEDMASLLDALSEEDYDQLYDHYCQAHLDRAIPVVEREEFKETLVKNLTDVVNFSRHFR